MESFEASKTVSSATQETSSTGLGVSLAVCGTLISALGNHFIVKSHTKKLEPWLSQLYFWLGNICVVILGTSLGILALAYAPQSLISPLGGLTIVWNLILAALPLFGSVRPRPVEVMATTVTLLGTMIIVWLGPENRGQRNSFWLLTQASFIVMVAVYSSLGLLLQVIRTRSKIYNRIASGAFGGLVGGMSNVFAKSAIDFHSGNQVTNESTDYFTFGVIVMIALALASTQLLFLNTALANFPAVQIVPIYQTSLIIAATISGGVAFNEFGDFSMLQYVGFGSGVLLSVLGVAVLASLSSSTATPNSDDAKD